MPLHYHTGALAEHHLVRRSVGLFDISHMGRLLFSGSKAAAELDRLISADILGLSDGHSCYGLLCRDDGTVIDDVFVYRFADEYLVVINAANRQRDISWIQERIDDSVVWSDESDSLSMIAVQGPAAMGITDDLAGGQAGVIPRFGCATIRIGGFRMRCGRTGYTGEDGVELFPDCNEVEAVWDLFFERAASARIDLGPCGLAARDSLRFEPGFHLYGHELRDDITPVEARVKWACHLDRDFIGRDAIVRRAEEGPARRLATIVMRERGVPREGYGVTDGAGTAIGEVASGMFAPSVREYAANVFVDTRYAKVGTPLAVDIRGREKQADVVKRPLYKPQYK